MTGLSPNQTVALLIADKRPPLTEGWDGVRRRTIYSLVERGLLEPGLTSIDFKLTQAGKAWVDGYNQGRRAVAKAMGVKLSKELADQYEEQA